MKKRILKTQLYKHQKKAVEKLLPLRVGALFMEMGTGKTRTAIEIAVRRLNKIKKIVWFCPVTLKKTVEKEIFKHSTFNERDVYLFDYKTNEKIIPKCTWYIIGIESMSSSARIVGCADFLIDSNTMVIVDESTFIKGHSSKRTLRITFLSQRSRYRLILTGTPIPQGIVDLYSQMKFLSPNILKFNSFYSFSAKHLEYDKIFKGRIICSHNTDLIAQKINPYVYQVTKKECLDLPHKIYKKYFFDMSETQRYLYNRLKEYLIAELIDKDSMDVGMVLRLFTALQQIVCGFYNPSHIKASNDGIIKLENYRTELLRYAICKVPHKEKIVIWAKYLWDIDEIKETIKMYFPLDSIAEFHGKLTYKQKQEQLEMFKNSARFFVSTISSGGYGLTLTESCHVIFYSNSFKYSERIQAEDRNHRIGQNRKVTYTDIICANSIDERIDQSIDGKKDLLEEFKKSINKIKDNKIKAKEYIRGL